MHVASSSPSAPSVLLFGTIYMQDYRQSVKKTDADQFANVTFLNDMPFDTDIDPNFVRNYIFKIMMF